MSKSCSQCGVELDAEEVRCPACLELNASRLTSAIDRYYDESTEVSQQGCATYRLRETFHEKVNLVFPRVEAVAREGRIATQSEVWGNNVDFWAMKHYLGAVSAIEHWDNRPLLSSVIINSDRGFPAEGYFELVRWLGISTDVMERTEPEKEAWWQEEVGKVHAYWGDD